MNNASVHLGNMHAALEKERDQFSVRRIPLELSDQWSLTSGALTHSSGGFFNIVGARLRGQADRIFIYQPQAAITGLITSRQSNERFFLIQARAEPGNPGGIQFGPTVQSTAANYLGLHDGGPTPYIDKFLRHDPRIRVLADSTQTDLGERYLYKTKRAIVIELDEMDEPASSFLWVSGRVISKAVSLGLFLNPDLRTLLALSPWSISPEDGELYPSSSAARKSLAAPLRARRLGAVMTQAHPDQPPVQFQSIQTLKGWSIGQFGIDEIEPGQGISVGMYETTVRHREVKNWSQPLIEANSPGHAVMICRHSAAGIEVFTSFAAETGFGDSVGLGPSYWRYPGAPTASPAWFEEESIRFVREVEESDEGGRFYKNIWLYQFGLLEGRRKINLKNKGVWLRLSELKSLLLTSNICTIQLRAMYSHLLTAPLD